VEIRGHLLLPIILTDGSRSLEKSTNLGSGLKRASQQWKIGKISVANFIAREARYSACEALREKRCWGALVEYTRRVSHGSDISSSSTKWNHKIK